MKVNKRSDKLETLIEMLLKDMLNYETTWDKQRKKCSEEECPAEFDGIITEDTDALLRQLCPEIHKKFNIGCNCENCNKT